MSQLHKISVYVHFNARIRSVHAVYYRIRSPLCDSILWRKDPSFLLNKHTAYELTVNCYSKL